MPRLSGKCVGVELKTPGSGANRSRKDEDGEEQRGTKLLKKVKNKEGI